MGEHDLIQLTTSQCNILFAMSHGQILVFERKTGKCMVSEQPFDQKDVRGLRRNWLIKQKCISPSYRYYTITNKGKDIFSYCLPKR